MVVYAITMRRWRATALKLLQNHELFSKGASVSSKWKELSLGRNGDPEVEWSDTSSVYPFSTRSSMVSASLTADKASTRDKRPLRTMLSRRREKEGCKSDKQNDVLASIAPILRFAGYQTIL
jgi:hypothetical protein